MNNVMKNFSISKIIYKDVSTENIIISKQFFNIFNAFGVCCFFGANTIAYSGSKSITSKTVDYEAGKQIINNNYYL